jgi:hypothetical protein
MVQRERDDDEAPGLTEMVLDSEDDEDKPQAQAEHGEASDPSGDEHELPLAGQ